MYYRPLCMFALHYLQDAGAAEDIAQEAFRVLWEKLSSGNEIGNKKSYLFSTVRNRCIDSLRKSRSSVNVPIDSCDEDSCCTGGDTADTGDYMEDSFREAALWTAIDRLPDKCRKVFLMAKRDGMKYEEIAEKLDISENTVRNQVSKALKTLKNGVKKLAIYIFC